MLAALLSFHTAMLAACEKSIKQRSGEQTGAGADESGTEGPQEAGEKLTGAAKSLCIPFEQQKLAAGTKCIGECGADAKHFTLFGRSY